MQPIIMFNNSTSDCTVFQSYASATIGVGSDMIGSIGSYELFTVLEEYQYVYMVKLRMGGVYQVGYVYIPDVKDVKAYASSRSYSTARETIYPSAAAGGGSFSGYRFGLQSTAAIYNGTSRRTTLFEGDAIYTDGNSSGGMGNPMRLSITGFRKDGVHYAASGHWVDLKLDQAAQYTSTVNVYGKGWKA